MSEREQLLLQLKYLLRMVLEADLLRQFAQASANEPANNLSRETLRVGIVDSPDERSSTRERGSEVFLFAQKN